MKRQRRKYTGMAFRDNRNPDVLKFKIMQDGIWYGTLTIQGHINWQKCRKPTTGKVVSFRKRVFEN